MPCRKKKAQRYFDEFENFSVNIPWDCFVYIMTRFLGFEMVNKGGSRRAFVNGEIRFIADEPHERGDDYIHKADRKKAIRAMRMLD